MGVLLDLLIEDEHLKEIAVLKAGESNPFGNLKVSTARSYLQNIENHIRPRWETTPISKVKPAQVAEWLRGLRYSPVTKAHIKALLHRLFNRAMLWELVPVQVNPMSLVEIKGASKRQQDSVSSGLGTVREFAATASATLPDDGAGGAVYRAESRRVLALQWNDIDFEGLLMRVCRGVVRGVVMSRRNLCAR